MSIINIIESKFNIAQAQATSQVLMNHAQSAHEQITVLQEKEINEQNAAICLPAVKIVQAELSGREVVLKSRLLQLQDSYHQISNSPSQNSSPAGQQKLQEILVTKDALLKELREVKKKIKDNEKIQSFLKVRKIEIKLSNLCIASEGNYDRLEARKNSLIEKKKQLQVLCSDVGFSNLAQELPQIIVSLQAEQKAALDAVAFIQELSDWYVAEGSSVGAKKACEEILTCYLKENKTLNISSCTLGTLPKVVGKLTQLKVLYIGGNQLQTLPSEIGQLTQLEELQIGSNQLQTLPSEIGKLTQLKVLYIGNNRLQTLPSEIGQLTQLKTLRIESNQFQTLPSEIGQLTQLKVLHIEDNQLQTLPSEIGQLTQLEELYIGGNQLQTLPSELGQLTQLKVLHIEKNQLQTLPSEIGQLTQLEELYIGGNQLQTLPSELGQLTQLKELYIENNQLQTLPSELGQLTQLKELYIENNQLQTLPSRLACLQSCCTICVQENRLSYGAVQTFQAQITQQQSVNPQCGPIFQYSIYDRNKLSEDSTLEQIITFWLQQFQGNFSCKNIHYKALPPCMFESMGGNDFYKPLQNLSPEDNNNLRTYLIGLKQTDDFTHPGACQGLILNTVCMLHGACTNEKFKEMLFFLLEGALGTCGDRVANASNMIHLQWLLYCGPKTLTKKQTAKLLVGAMRVDKLECFARKITKERKLGDEIETILYFKKELKKMINLPIATEGMLYPAMSGVTPSDLQQAQAFILEDTSSTDQILAILMSLDVWKEKLSQENAKQLEENTKKLEEIKEKFGAKLEELLNNDTLTESDVLVLSKQLTEDREKAIEACVVEQVNVVELTKALVADVSAFCPATQVLAGLGITTKEEYSQKLGCEPKHLQSIGILTASDLAVLGISNNPLSHLPKPEAEVEKPADFREVQQVALKKKECVMDCLNNMAEKVKEKLKLNPEDESLQKTCTALLEKIEVAASDLQKECQTSKDLLTTFGLKSHIQIVNGANALVNEFNKVDCASQVAKLNAYISQWGILKTWKELKEKGIQCLEELKEQGAVENFFQKGGKPGGI